MRVTNAYGMILSAPAQLSLTAIPPAITVAPYSRVDPLGSTVNFTVAATGTAPLNYQWSFNGTPIAGATNAVLVLTNIQLSAAGSYLNNVFENWRDKLISLILQVQYNKKGLF